MEGWLQAVSYVGAQSGGHAAATGEGQAGRTQERVTFKAPSATCPKEGWAASAPLPPERPFPASESPQGQERGSPTRSPPTSSASSQEDQAVREGRLAEATGMLQGPSTEQGLLQGARGQASHTPACTQHPRIYKGGCEEKAKEWI